MQISPPLPIKVYEKPKEGARAARIDLFFPDDNGSLADLSLIQFMGEQCTIQTLFIDNSGNAQSLSIQTNSLMQTIFVPPNSQGYVPVLSTQPLKLQFNSTGSGAVHIFALNYSVNPAMWGLSAAGSVPNPLHVIVDSGHVDVDNFPVSYPVTQVTNPWDVSAVQSGAWVVRANQGTPGAAPWPVDATGSLVGAAQSGAWSVGVNNFPAIQPASQSGAWSVAVNNLPAVQPVSQSGTWNFGAQKLQRVSCAAAGSQNAFTSAATKLCCVYAQTSLLVATTRISITLLDGAGNTLLVIIAPSSASALNYVFCDLSDLNVPLNQAGNPMTITTGGAITSGTVELSLGVI